jgi:YVTN family beta-propeller protein
MKLLDEFFLQRGAKFSEGIGETEISMKNNQKNIHSRPRLSRLRIAAAGILVLAAAGLAATSMKPPKLPWAVPTVTVGNSPGTAAVDQATNTIYVANGNDNTVSVIDGSKCSSKNSSRCSPIATLTVGPNPLFMAFDPTTSTLYVTIAGGAQNTIAVVNGKTCNAKNISGCGQTPATVMVPGATFNNASGNASNLALDTATDTLYIADANDGPVSILNTATCNGTNTPGCSQTPLTTATNGDSLTIDHTNHSVYATDFVDGTLSVLNGATCNAGDTSSCGQTAGPFVVPGEGAPGAVDESSHTVYLGVGSGAAVLDHVAMINGSTCNGTVTSGCGNTPPMVQVGDSPGEIVIDPTTKTIYVINQGSSTISVINAGTCNATNQSGCGPTPLPAVAIGVFTFGFDIDLETHTLYAESQDTNTVWVLDASKCNAMHTSGCTMFEPTTTVGANPVGIAENPNTKTVYVANSEANTVSVIDTTVCNEDHLAGCKQSWPTIAVGNAPRLIGINKITNTIYVSNLNDNTLSVVNGAACNGKMTSTSGCTPQSTTTVGGQPQQVLVDEATNTIYVVNQLDGTVSVVNGVNCNGTDITGCGQAWPTITVGNSPQALGLNPNNHTIYVTNTNDNTVSVINGVHCNRTDTTGCVPAATIPVGAGPRSVGIVLDKNTVFVGNRDDLTVSVIDGSTCNGTNTMGCSQTPPAVLVGAFPSTGGTNNNVLGRSIAVDSKKHTIYIPNLGDSDVATLDTNACRAGHVKDCHVTIVHGRMGGAPDVATVDESSGTVYVSDAFDGTVSLFPTRSPCDENHGDGQADVEGCD